MTAAAVESSDPFVSAFEAFEHREQNGAPGWLQSVRKAGIAHFSELGIPATADEEGRFTNPAPIAELPLRLPDGPGPAGSAQIQPLLIPGAAAVLVFVNGFHVPELSTRGILPDGVIAGSMRESFASAPPALQQHLARLARFDDNAFAALNTAFLRDGAFVVIPPGVILDGPIQLLFLCNAAQPVPAVHARVLAVAQKGSRARIVEQYASLTPAASFTNAVTELVVEEDAHLEHCKIQEENLACYHVALVQGRQRGRSKLLTHSISTGALLARNNIHVILDESGAECIMNGLYLTKDSQMVDHHTAIHHAQPHCQSHEFYHGILDGKSQGVFNGKIFVRPDAQKTDAKQTNRNLLLSDDATIHTKPQLEIFADDVKCTHGATVGQLDAEAIFYLRARGIGLEQARRMLIHAFACDIVNRIPIPELRERIDQLLFDRYEGPA